MSSTSSIVESAYRINVYLDTNVLVDYVEKAFPLLTRSIDYLAECPFVNLRSSHYVLFEFTEVRKARLFWEKADPTKAQRFDEVRSSIKQDWVYNGEKYMDFGDEISKQVNQEHELIKNDLHIDFDEHVLHDGLVYPTNNLCLATKISKEDCLVMVSCMHPQKEEKLNHCLLLTRDERYFKAYTENQTQVDFVFKKDELIRPTLIRTEDLRIDEHSTQFNLYLGNSSADIEHFWQCLILKTLRNELSSQYVGSTYVYGVSEEAKNCIYFEMDGANKTLRESLGLYFISNDLKNKYIISGPFEYWNGKKISLPHSNPGWPFYSFLKNGLDPTILAKLREKGNLVFYYDI